MKIVDGLAHIRKLRAIVRISLSNRWCPN